MKLFFKNPLNLSPVFNFDSVSNSLCQLVSQCVSQSQAYSPLESVKTYAVIQSALDKLGLSHIQFERLEENYEKLRNFGKMSPQIRGTEGSLIVNVPGKGDSWLTTLE